jgi:rubredoxin
MQCNTCGNEFDDRTGTCRCHADPGKVQILSPEERENFNGMTIEQDSGNCKNAQNGSPFQKIFMFQSSSGGMLAKLMISALLLIVVVFFLPLAILLIATLGLSWLSSRSKQ